MLSTRLKALRKERGLTQGDLAKRFGITQQAIAKWESARSLPDSVTIARLAEFFEISADYLLGVTDSFRPASPFGSVRIIGTVKAGYNAQAFEEDLGAAPAAVTDADEYRYLVVKGNSMAPFIREGDLALVKLQPYLQNGDLGVVIYGDGEATLKKYYNDGSAVTLVPFNDEYETITVEGHDLESLIIFGKVIQTSTNW